MYDDYEGVALGAFALSLRTSNGGISWDYLFIDDDDFQPHLNYTYGDNQSWRKSAQNEGYAVGELGKYYVTDDTKIVSESNFTLYEIKNVKYDTLPKIPDSSTQNNKWMTYTYEFSKKVSTAIGLGAAVTFVLAITVPLNWLLDQYILQDGALAWLHPSLVDYDLSFLSFIMFIATIATMVQLVEIIVEKFSPSLYNSLGIFLPLIAVNCAIPVSYTHLTLPTKRIV